VLVGLPRAMELLSASREFSPARMKALPEHFRENSASDTDAKKARVAEQVKR